MARTTKQRKAEEAAQRATSHASSALIAWLAGVSQAAVSDAIASGGCPRQPDGSLDWREVRAWAQREGRWGYGRPRSEPLLTGDRATIESYRAKMARLEYEQRIGTLIPRDDAVSAQIRLAAEFRATLLTLPEHLALQLANLTSREVEEVLRERIHGMLGRCSEGQVPIPKSIVDAIADLVAQHLAESASKVPA